MASLAASGPHETRYLASFVGCMSNQAVRLRLLEIRDESFWIVDNTEAFLSAIRGGRDDELDRLKRQYAERLAASQFVLCPRGYGTSSIRLFEAMEMGRAAVVLSDLWVPPEGPRWEDFIIRVRERDARKLPAILREHEGTSAARGESARRAWKEWYSPDRLFHNLCATCEDMLQRRRVPEWATRWLCYLHFARPSHARRLLRGLRRRA